MDLLEIERNLGANNDKPLGFTTDAIYDALKKIHGVIG